GFFGATLVRLAPGFGVDEEELDSRLNHESIQALRQSHARHESLGGFYIHYLGRLINGDLGTSRSLQQPVTQLLADRFPETLNSVGLAWLWAGHLAWRWPSRRLCLEAGWLISSAAFWRELFCACLLPCSRFCLLWRAPRGAWFWA